MWELPYMPHLPGLEPVGCVASCSFSCYGLGRLPKGIEALCCYWVSPMSSNMYHNCALREDGVAIC